MLTTVRSREELNYADGFPRTCYLSPGRKPQPRIETDGDEERSAQATKREAPSNDLNEANLVTGLHSEGSETSCGRTESATADRKEEVIIRAEEHFRGNHDGADMTGQLL
jgi:hypothetical protein